MKKIVEKILESGLVDKHTALLLEKWGQLERGASDVVGKNDLRKASEDALIKFAEEIDDLIEETKQELRETRLQIEVGEPLLVHWADPFLEHKTVVFRDRAGDFIFPLSEQKNLYPGALFTINEKGWRIYSSQKLYKGDQVYAIQVWAEEVE